MQNILTCKMDYKSLFYMKSFSTSVLKAHIWTLCSLLKIVNDHDTLRILNWTSTLCLSSYWYLSSADLEIFVHPIDKKNFTVRQIVITLVFMRITTRIRCWFNSANKLSLRHRFQKFVKKWWSRTPKTFQMSQVILWSSQDELLAQICVLHIVYEHNVVRNLIRTIPQTRFVWKCETRSK